MLSVAPPLLLLRRAGSGARRLLLRFSTTSGRGLSSSSSSKLLDSFATVDPEALSGAQPYQVYNLVSGGWTLPKASAATPDPLNGEPFLKIPDTQEGDLQPFVDSLRGVPKSGLHNPFKVWECVGVWMGRFHRRCHHTHITHTMHTTRPRHAQNPSRYILYGDVSARAAQMLRDPEVEHFFTRLIQRVAPKSYAQGASDCLCVMDGWMDGCAWIRGGWMVVCVSIDVGTDLHRQILRTHAWVGARSQGRGDHLPRLLRELLRGPGPSRFAFAFPLPCIHLLYM